MFFALFFLEISHCLRDNGWSNYYSKTDQIIHFNFFLFDNHKNTENILSTCGTHVGHVQSCPLNPHYWSVTCPLGSLYTGWKHAKQHPSDLSSILKKKPFSHILSCPFSKFLKLQHFLHTDGVGTRDDFTKKTHTQITQSITKVLKQSEVAYNVQFLESVMRFLIIFPPNKII